MSVYSMPSSNDSPAHGPLTYQTVAAPNTATTAADQFTSNRRRVSGAPAGGRRRVTGAPSPQDVRRRSVDVLPPGQAHFLAPGNHHGSPQASPLRKVKLAPSTQAPLVTSSPIVRRRVKGAPTFRKGPSPFAAAATVMQSTLHSAEGTTADNMALFRKEMGEMPTVPASPKGHKWNRVKERVQWEEGSSCAVCMTGALTGRLKPCGHRSMCEACYDEVLSEGRGVYCPSCFQEATVLRSDSVLSNSSNSSNEFHQASDEYDPEEEGFVFGRLNQRTASLHLQASRAGTKLEAPSLCGTSATEIGQAFGTGIGTLFLHVGYLLLLLFVLTCGQIPTMLGNAAGELVETKTHVGTGRSARPTGEQPPNVFVGTTLGNCGISSCSIDGKWYIVVCDAVAMVVFGLLTIWIRASVVIFEYQHKSGGSGSGREVSHILKDASRTLLIEGCDAAVIQEKDLFRYFRKMGNDHGGNGAGGAGGAGGASGRTMADRRLRGTSNNKTSVGRPQTGLLRVDMLSNVEAIELDLMEQRRRCAMYLRIAQAKLDWGDRTSECSGECLSEEEWGHLVVPKMEQKLKKIEQKLVELETTSAQTVNAFLWFSTSYERNYVVKTLTALDSIHTCEDVGKEVGQRYLWNVFERCIGCSTAGRKFRLAGTSLGDGMHGATCSTHPALFPANLVHRNMKVTSEERLVWRLSAIALLIVVVGICTGIYASNIRGSRFTTAFLLLVVNQLVPPAITLMVRQQRAYLRTEQSDVICFLSFFVVAANVFYFTLFSAFYSSRDGGLATWEHMFTLQWYQSGGGDVLHYYVLLDCVMNPFVLAVRTGRQRMIRAKKLRKAVCQEQLNQVHTGIELDYMCEYLLALVCPAISIVLCQGLPMLPLISFVGLALKYYSLKHVLFYESAVPLWRDGTLVRWGGYIIQLACLAHFWFASAMLVSANQVDLETSDSVKEYAVGLYAIHPLAFVGLGCMMFGTKCLTSCYVNNMRNKEHRDAAKKHSAQVELSTKLPSGKVQRDAIERTRKEQQEQEAQKEKEEKEVYRSTLKKKFAVGGEEEASSSDEEGDGGGGRGGETKERLRSAVGSSSSDDEEDDWEEENDNDLTATETFNSILKQLDEQAERAWGANLVVNPAEIKSFDASGHPYFGAEIKLRRAMRLKLLNIDRLSSKIQEEEDNTEEGAHSQAAAKSGGGGGGGAGGKKKNSGSKIGEKIERRRIMRTGKKAKAAAAAMAKQSAQSIKDKLKKYVEKSKKKKAKKIKVSKTAKEMERRGRVARGGSAVSARRKARNRPRAGNHIV